jgi:hypothetical protein
LNVADLHGGVSLPVAALNLVLPGLFELQDFELRPATLRNNLSDHFGLGGLRAGNDFLVVGADGEDVFKCDFAANLAFEQFLLNGLTRLDALLLSPTPNYGVHAASQSD